MTPKAFRKLVIAYGGDLSHWPAAQRVPARALARATPELAALLEEAARLDQALQQVASRSELSEQRLRRLIERAAREIADAAGRPGLLLRRRGRAPEAEDC